MAERKNLFPLNPLDIKLANTHEPEFFAQEFHKDVAVTALVAGTVDVDVDSVFGKGVGEIEGAVLLNSGGTDEVIGINVVEHASTSGKVTVTINSSDATSTTALGTVSFWLFGRPKPASYSY